jgi:ABC-type lipoprotein release transport system permease subunit
VRDVKYGALTADAEPAFYIVTGQNPILRQSVVVTTSLADPMRIAGELRAEIAKLDPQLPVEFEAVPALVASTISRQRLGRDLMVLFGLVALAPAAVGHYGVIAYTSSHRSGEMATRMALGATPTNIFWLVVSQGRVLVASGAVLGVAVPSATGRLASRWLHEVKASDPVILVVALGLVLGVALLATVLPARRASRLEPARALRTE